MAAPLALFDDLDAAGRDAGAALDRAVRPWLFDRLDWFRLVRDYTPEGDPLVIRARGEGSRAWLFLARKGAYAQALSNWYCLRFGPVVDGADTAVLGLANGLRKAGISHLFLSPIGADDPLPQALKRTGWAIARSKSNESWRVTTKGISFDQYWADRPSRLRNTARRRAKTPGLELIIHDAFDAKGWADYESVYEASWKPPEGSPALMRALAEQEGEAGTLRLGLAYLEGRPVAAQLWLIENKVATIHKLSYAEDAKQFSPGTVLSAEMFRRAIDVDKAELIDFGIGSDAYKAEWMSECVPLYALTAYDLLSLRGLAGAARAAAAKLVPAQRSR